MPIFNGHSVEKQAQSEGHGSGVMLPQNYAEFGEGRLPPSQKSARFTRQIHPIG
ncbi:hypothetical protein Q5H93_04660 [Hymenobacter sp. ASUV-10]|uniref:Uncharacterized protein n=1 Tax=Hymenobacter aranciens TaxID=3063996 RepID=A0ABT9BBD5_9BACT|nr:hypothetical protein [Hymenobacter sp. ASUV-10]MDO7874016.1 hypothetical protein [Hymenobacter sp. ASUV-10]